MSEQVSIDFTTIRVPQHASADNHPEPLLLTIIEAAHVLGCGRTLIYELLNAGELEGCQDPPPSPHPGRFAQRLRRPSPRRPSGVTAATRGSCTPRCPDQLREAILAGTWSQPRTSHRKVLPTGRSTSAGSGGWRGKSVTGSVLPSQRGRSLSFTPLNWPRSAAKTLPKTPPPTMR